MGLGAFVLGVVIMLVSLVVWVVIGGFFVLRLNMGVVGGWRFCMGVLGVGVLRVILVICLVVVFTVIFCMVLLFLGWLGVGGDGHCVGGRGGGPLVGGGILTGIVERDGVYGRTVGRLGLTKCNGKRNNPGS